MTERDSSSYSGNFQSKWFSTESFKCGSLELVLSGTATGSVRVRYTNSIAQNPPGVNAGQSDPDSELELSNDVSHAWELTKLGFKWVCLEATCTGAGSFTVDFVGKR